MRTPLISRSSDVAGEAADASPNFVTNSHHKPRSFFHVSPEKCAIEFSSDTIASIASNEQRFIRAFAYAFASSVGLLCLGLFLIGQDPTGPLTTIHFSRTNLIGAFFIFTSCSLGAKLMSTAIIFAAHIRSRNHSLFALFCCGCCCAGLYAYGWGGLLLGSLPCYFGNAQDPQGISPTSPSGTGPLVGCQGITSFSVFIGVIYTLIFLPMAVVSMCAAYKVSRKRFLAASLPNCSANASSPPTYGSVHEMHPSLLRSMVIGCFSVAFFLLCMSCTTFLTWQFAAYAADGYLLPGTGFPVNTNYTNNYFQGNYNPLNFALFVWNKTGPVIVQLWPDVVIFASFILALFLLGFAVRLSPMIASILNKQLRLRKFGTVGYGAFFLLMWTVAFLAMWVYYWSTLYCDLSCMSDPSKTKFQCCRLFQETLKCTRILSDPKYGCGTPSQQANAAFYGVTVSQIDNCTGTSQCEPYGTTLFPVSNWQYHVAARVIGHCSYLLLSLLMYPVSKQSVFAHLYGSHFPRILMFHRYAGTAAFLLATVHAFIWYIIWLMDGTFGSNLIASEDLLISPACPHHDQFTIPVMQTLWLLMLVSLILAVFYRRRTGMYHLFRQAHLVGPIFVAAAAYHAFSSWYYIAPPALLWLFDRQLRLYRAATSPSPCRVVREGTGQEGAVVVIQFPAIPHQAGQFGYLACPDISADNWHPFTIASSPCDSCTTIVVKDMGSGTWTRQLHEYIARCLHEGAVPQLWFDAAYGGVCDLSRSSEIILVAGGIGITPIISVLRQLCHIFTVRCSTDSFSSNDSSFLPRVTLVWSVRQGFLLSLFSEHLLDVIQTHFSLSLVTIKVYYTALNPVMPSDMPLELKSIVSLGARPDLSGVFAAAKERSLRRDANPSAVLAVACGPNSLTTGVESLWYFPHVHLNICFSLKLNNNPPPLKQS